MIEEQLSSETSKQTLIHDLHRLPSIQNDIPTTIVLNSHSEGCRCQVLLYITILYLLAVTVFYLMVSLAKKLPIQCQLLCSTSSGLCEGKVGSLAWTQPTVIELNWQLSSILEDVELSESIEGAMISFRNETIGLNLDPQIEYACYPTGCQAFLSLLDSAISDNSQFTIIFKKFPIKDTGSLRAIFREYDQKYPQLSTRRQLGINLVFAILISIFTFLRKHLPLDNSVRQGEVREIEEKEEEVPHQIMELDQELAISYEKALGAYIKFMEESNQFDFDSEDCLGLYD